MTADVLIIKGIAGLVTISLYKQGRQIKSMTLMAEEWAELKKKIQEENL